MPSVNNSLIGAVRAEATLESGKFVDGAKKIRQEAIKTESTLKKSFGGATAAIKGFGGALAAGLSFGLLTGIAKKVIDFAQEIGTVAKQLGVTTKELQVFRYAASQLGIKTAESDKALERFSVSLSKAASGSKPTIAAFKAVGVGLEDIKTKSKTEIFGQIADQMIKQGGAVRNLAAGQVIFGEGVSKLIPLLDRGSDGFREYSEAAERLGIILSDEQIKKFEDAKRVLDDLQKVLLVQIAGVVADNAASITTLAGALAQLTKAIVGFLGSNPQAALGILGALAGSRFGLPGAAAGGIAGIFAGGRLAGGARDSSSDLKLRKSELAKSRAELARVSSLYGGTGVNKDQIAAARKEVQKQSALAMQAAAAALAKTRKTSSPDLPQFLAPAAGGGRTRRARAGPKDRSEQYQQEFERDERRAQIDILRAKQALATDYSERATLSVQILDLEREGYQDQLEYEVGQGKLTQAQADQLLTLYDIEDSLKRQAIIADEQERVAEDANRYQALILDLDRDLLESQAQLADTAEEQRKVQLAILELAYRQRRAALDAAIATEKDAAAIQRLTLERDRLDETFANNRQGVINSTRGPLEGYLATLPSDAEKMNEALENVAVNGLQSLEDGLLSIIDGTKSVEEAFRDMAKSIIADLIRIMIQKMIMQAVGAAVGVPVGGFSSGGYTGDGFASGGFTGRGSFRKIAGVVHAREFVLNAQATRRLGVPNLNALNNGAPISAVSNDNSMSSAPITININAPMTREQARVTGAQAAAGWRSEIARSAKTGH